jgi:hypothetical protein
MALIGAPDLEGLDWTVPPAATRRDIAARPLGMASSTQIPREIFVHFTHMG